MTSVEFLMARLPEDSDAALVTTPTNRRYLTGFPSSDGAVLVMRDRAVFLTDSRYIEAARRSVKAMTCTGYTRLSETLTALVADWGVSRLYLEAEGVTIADKARYARMLPDTPLAVDGELDGWLQELRLVKTATELQLIEQAQALTDEGYAHILEFIRPGRTEREIALELEFFIRRQGAEGVAFEFIVVSGANSSLPHGVPGDKSVEAGDLVTMDFGAVVDGWHADMTRTVAVGEPGEEARRVYDTVLRAQQTCLDGLHAGMTGAAADALARDVIVAAGYGARFGHGTGHGVGLDIHEEPRLSPSAGAAPLRAGSIVTVEPGIYLEGRFGVRIEDMVCLTETGCRNLTKSPKSLCIL